MTLTSRVPEHGFQVIISIRMPTVHGITRPSGVFLRGKGFPRPPPLRFLRGLNHSAGHNMKQPLAPSQVTVAPIRLSLAMEPRILVQTCASGSPSVMVMVISR